MTQPFVPSETLHVNRPDLSVCMLSVHTCPLAMLGGKETGGMNVYMYAIWRSSWVAAGSQWMSLPARRMITCRASRTSWGRPRR